MKWKFREKEAVLEQNFRGQRNKMSKDLYFQRSNYDQLGNYLWCEISENKLWISLYCTAKISP